MKILRWDPQNLRFSVFFFFEFWAENLMRPIAKRRDCQLHHFDFYFLLVSCCSQNQFSLCFLVVVFFDFWSENLVRSKRRHCQLHHIFFFFRQLWLKSSFAFFLKYEYVPTSSSRKKTHTAQLAIPPFCPQVRGRVEFSAQNSKKTTDKVSGQLKSKRWPAQPVLYCCIIVQYEYE